jgi:hypothetical protein
MFGVQMSKFILDMCFGLLGMNVEFLAEIGSAKGKSEKGK